MVDSGHDGGSESTVQCVHMDGARIFSVDSTGELVIHDFLDHTARRNLPTPGAMRYATV